MGIMHYLLTFLIAFLSVAMHPARMFAAPGVNGDAKRNIVIPEVNSTFVISADKEGKTVTRIRHHLVTTYRATSAPATAKAYVFYDDTQNIDKAKAKGAKPVYTKATGSGIFFDDSRVCLLNIPIEEVGKDVEAVFDRTFNRPDFATISFLGSIYPIERYSLTYRMPVSLQGVIDVVGHNLPPQVKIDRGISADGKEYVVSVTATDLPEFKYEADAPPARRVYPYVQLTGFYTDVNQLYESLRSYTLASDPDPASVEAMARKVTSDCTNDSERIAAISDWVHDNIRYIAIEHGDLGNTPDHPSEVLRKRFGDCKGSASLIKAMLRTVGIDGRLVWIGSDNIADDWTETPLFSTGDHMIAAAILPGDSVVYLDGTVGMADCGLYLPSIQGKQTIIENGDTPMIHRVPVLPPSVNTDSIHIDYNIDGINGLRGSLTESISGFYKASLLNLLRGSDATKRDNILSRYIREQRRGFDVMEVKIENSSPCGGPSVLRAEVVDKKAVTRSAGKTYVALGLYPGIVSLVYDMNKRRQPVFLRGLYAIRRSATLYIPDGARPVSIPADFNIATPNFNASFICRLEGQKLTVALSLTVEKRMIPFDGLQEHNDAVRALAKVLSERIILESAG